MGYKEKVEMGLCGWCGENNDNGKKLCDECGKIARDRTNKRASKLRSAGKCRTCGKELDKRGVRCKNCSKKHDEIGRRKTSSRREQGVCPKCGKKRDSKYKHWYIRSLVLSSIVTSHLFLLVFKLGRTTCLFTKGNWANLFSMSSIRIM